MLQETAPEVVAASLEPPPRPQSRPQPQPAAVPPVQSKPAPRKKIIAKGLNVKGVDVAMPGSMQATIMQAVTCPINKANHIRISAVSHFVWGFQSVMSDPVVAGDDHTYERSAITKWLQTNRMYATPRQSILSTKHHCCCCCLQIPGNPRTNRQPKADTELRCEAPDRRLAARWFPWCASRASRTRGGRRFRLRVRDAGGEFHKLRAG